MFERKYVETVLDIAKSHGMTQLEFVRAVWPNKSDASATTTIIALKRQNSRGKPQNLRVSDAIAMAAVIGREYPSLCFEVWEKIKCSEKKNASLTINKSIATDGAFSKMTKNNFPIDSSISTSTESLEKNYE